MTVHVPRLQQIAIMMCLPVVNFLRFFPRRKQRLLTPPDCDWHHRYSDGDIMRRRINGEWQLRAMTDEENKHYMADRW